MKEHHYFNLGLCPSCGSGRIRVTTTQKPRRRYKCLVCENTWGCLEVVETKGWLSGVLEILLSQGRFSEYDFKTRQHIRAICDRIGTYL